jgi:DNA-binding transcriptional LysR family regulator
VMTTILIRFERHGGCPGSGTGPWYTVQSSPPNDRSVQQGQRDGKSRRISVDGRIIVNDPDLAVRAAVDGLAIVYTVETRVDPFLRSAKLVRVLEDWSPSFEGLFLYYPGHRQVPVALRALIDMLRSARGSVPAKRSLEHSLAAD